MKATAGITFESPAPAHLLTRRGLTTPLPSSSTRPACSDITGMLTKVALRDPHAYILPSTRRTLAAGEVVLMTFQLVHVEPQTGRRHVRRR